MSRAVLVARTCARARVSSAASLAFVSIILGGCAVGPNYHRPAVVTPTAFSEPRPWKAAEPKDTLPKSDWWTIFHDPTLDQLEKQAQTANPNLQAALAHYDAALALAGVSRAALLPSVSVNANGSRERFSANRQTPNNSTRFAYTTNSFEIPLQLNYELDVFGKARRALESARAAAESQGSIYQNVLLSLQSAVAQDYFNLRSLRAQQDIFAKNIALLQDALDLVQKLRAGGVNSDVDYYQAQAQLETVRGAALTVDQNIADQIHALAVVIGQNPESFSITLDNILPDPPVVPVGLPSDLLERRPDVAAAERNVASLNAQIGVAKAAFFPSISLNGFAGYNSSDLNKLFDASSREWGFGPSVDVPIFRGGLLTANLRVAKANYEAGVANYRAQVLTAFEEVENGLSDLHVLDEQNIVLKRAVETSQHLYDLSSSRYQNGLVSYLEVIDAQRTLLQNRLSLTQNEAQRLAATIVLIKAVGGGW
jgi:multidrug efflux system outer membrane protein